MSLHDGSSRPPPLRGDQPTLSVDGEEVGVADPLGPGSTSLSEAVGPGLSLPEGCPEPGSSVGQSSGCSSSRTTGGTQPPSGSPPGWFAGPEPSVSPLPESSSFCVLLGVGVALGVALATSGAACGCLAGAAGASEGVPVGDEAVAGCRRLRSGFFCGSRSGSTVTGSRPGSSATTVVVDGVLRDSLPPDGCVAARAVPVRMAAHARAVTISADLRGREERRCAGTGPLRR